LKRLPAHVRGLFDLLCGGTPQLYGPQWQSLLKFADESQCTLFLQGAAGLPDWFAKEIDDRLARNAERRKRILQAYQEVSGTLRSRGLEFVLLKSFTHEDGFGIEGAQRVQYDLDFLLAASELSAGHAALLGIGYAPHGTSELSGLHGRPLVKPGDWRWRGDYYDPDMPIPVEMHGKLWDSATNRLAAPGWEAFWERRTLTHGGISSDGGIVIPALAEPDRVAFATLHVLSHILHNNLRLSHAFELARFLKTRAGDLPFWEAWRNLHDPALRALETISFRFAAEWFGCPFPAALQESWQSMDASVRSWFARFSFSPVVNLVQPNKDVVWLHAALLPGGRDRWSVLTKHLVPLRVPDRSEATGTSYTERFFRRARYHARALASALWNGLCWRWAASSTASETSAWKRPSV
jgi:hypothetical protein